MTENDKNLIAGLAFEAAAKEIGADITKLLKAIKTEYGREVFTMNELVTILKKCDFTEKEISAIIQDGLKNRNIGRVSFRRTSKRPARNNIIIIL